MRYPISIKREGGKRPPPRFPKITVVIRASVPARGPQHRIDCPFYFRHLFLLLTADLVAVYAQAQLYEDSYDVVNVERVCYEAPVEEHDEFFC
ncbi:MAG: hypothetical protein H7A36_02505 [Chlamydiales bacterium]|nr:hypothetical protein [Chlamydiales bacterium]